MAGRGRRRADARPAPDTDFAALRETWLDALGDLVEQHLDTAALTRLIETGAPSGLPVVPPGGPPGSAPGGPSDGPVRRA